VEQEGRALPLAQARILLLESLILLIDDEDIADAVEPRRRLVEGRADRFKGRARPIGEGGARPIEQRRLRFSEKDEDNRKNRDDGERKLGVTPSPRIPHRSVRHNSTRRLTQNAVVRTCRIPFVFSRTRPVPRATQERGSSAIDTGRPVSSRKT